MFEKINFPRLEAGFKIGFFYTVVRAQNMTERTSSSFGGRVLVGVLLLAVFGVSVWCLLQDRDMWPRGEVLGTALRPFIEGKNSEQALVARVIWDNYLETRANASRWSGLYWGLTFAAAVLSALAAVVLKLETIIKNEGAKKDIAAVFSVAAALMVTISISGDFQRKWQANRTAAAELERAGYEFLEKDGAEARSYLATIGQSLLKRHTAIVGGSEQRKPSQEPSRPASQSK